VERWSNGVMIRRLVLEETLQSEAIYNTPGL
jgi:hypothetical protein